MQRRWSLVSHFEWSVIQARGCRRSGSYYLLRGDFLKYISSQGITFCYDGQHLRLQWEKPFALGEEREVTVNYLIDRPVTGLFISFPDEAYPNRATYAASDEESERARYWLLSVDYPAVRTTLAFHFTVHSSFTTVANGALQNVEELPNSMKRGVIVICLS